MDWTQITAEASKFVPALEETSARYLEEIRGIAAGSGLTFLDVLAINIRSEIMFGLWTDDSSKVDPRPDACTSLGWKTSSGQSFLSQNWDWDVRQQPNLIVLRISQPDQGIPDLSMATEAGIIGKIGLNAAGVGCCLNAIRARGVNPRGLPVHFALRLILESQSMADAVSKLRAVGLAASSHILVADPTGSLGLECTSTSITELHPDERGRVIHANNLLLPHPDTDEPPWLADSQVRVDTMRELSGAVPEEQIGVDGLLELFKDEKNYPVSICRTQMEGSIFQTLFNIIMDLSVKKATVSFGRPSDIQETVVMAF